MATHYNLPLHLILDLDISVIERIQQAVEAMEEYRKLRLESRWDDLIQYAGHLAGLSEVIGHQISARSVIGGLVSDNLAASDQESQTFYAELRDSATPEADQERNKLLEELTIELGNPIDAQAELDRLLNGEGSLFEQANQFRSLFNDDEKKLISTFVRLRSLTTSAEFIGLFHKSVEQTLLFNEKLVDAIVEFPGIHLDTNDTDAINEQISLMKNSVEEGYAKLFNSLRDEVPVLEFKVITEGIYQETGSLSALIGRLLGSYLVLAQATDDIQDRQIQLQIALEATEWQSRTALLHIYSAYVLANVNSRNVNRWYSFEKKRVDTRELDSKVPQGAEVSIEQLIQDTSSGVGEMFQLYGIVTNLRIEDDPAPPKFSSFFELTDPVSGKFVKVRAHFFSLLNNGVSEGTYCRLNGFLRQDKPWLDNDTIGIDIDRVSLTQLREDSWIDDLTHRMRLYYTLFFDQMNMFYNRKLTNN